MDIMGFSRGITGMFPLVMVYASFLMLVFCGEDGANIETLSSIDVVLYAPSDSYSLCGAEASLVDFKWGIYWVFPSVESSEQLCAPALKVGASP